MASFGTLSSSPTGRVNHAGPDRQQPVAPGGAHALRAGVDFLYNDDRITFPRSVRGSYTFSSLANFLSGVYNNAGFTQTFGVTDVAQTNPNVGVYVQDEWKVGPQLTLNLGLRYDLQFLETINTDRDNVSPRARLCVVAVRLAPHDRPRQRRPVLRPRAAARARQRAAVGRQHDRSDQPAADRGEPVARAGRRAGLPEHPQRRRPVGDAAQPDDDGSAICRTRIRVRRASKSSSRLARRFTVSVGYQYLRGRDLLMSINQNVPTCVAAGTNNGCRPNPDYANNSQYSSAGDSNYHGLHVSFLQRPAKWGQYRVSYTLSKSMNNVGEFFFSSPIDPFDLSKDWGRSDDDQRHRLVFNGSVQTSMEPATTIWDHLTHGFQVSGMLQAYSALPFNITSGVTTIQGTAGRPIVDGAFIASATPASAATSSA